MVLKELDPAQLQQWVRAAQDGDTKAFAKIYDHFFTSVYRYAALRVPQTVAEDLVADIFVKAWEKLHTYKPQKNVPFGAWLFRIVRNMVIDAYRTAQTWEEVPEQMSDPDELNRAETATERSYTLRMVRKALEQLPARYREVLSLSYVAELPTDEIARVLRTSEGSIRILKFRALRKLEDLLPPDFKENL
jgi:RNA polymerase sigma-70 factor (ECF subfamily)